MKGNIITKMTLLSFAVLIVAVFASTLISAADESAPAILNTNDAQFLSQSPDPAMAGSYVEIRIKVENIGRNHMRDVMFQMLPEYPFSFYPGDDGERYLGTVYANQIGEDAFVLYYKLRVDAQADEGEYPVRLRYRTGTDTGWRMLDDFDVRVDTGDPILSLAEVKADPETARPGELVKLSLILDNLADTPIKDINVNLGLITSAGPSQTSLIQLPFAPVGSSNEKIIKLLDEGSEKEIGFTLITDAGAQAGIYKIPLTITYEDETGTRFSKEQIISLKVGIEPDLAVYLESDKPFIEGESGTLQVKFVNKGLGDIKFLYAKLKAGDEYEILSSESTYVGNIDSDDYETAEFTVRCKGKGDEVAEFPITIEYMDANNRKYSREIILKQKVYSRMQAKEEGLTKSNSTLIGVLITIAIVITGIILWRSLRKRKNAH